MGEQSAAVRAFLDRVTPAKRRRDAETLFGLMDRVTGEQPQLRATAVGYGQYHYKYKSGREGDAPAAGFAPRKAATSVYLVDGIGRYEQQLAKLGSHTPASAARGGSGANAPVLCALHPTRQVDCGQDG